MKKSKETNITGLFLIFVTMGFILGFMVGDLWRGAILRGEAIKHGYMKTIKSPDNKNLYYWVEK